MFWTLNPNRLKPYVKANEKREERKMNDYDTISWLIGQYCCEAVSVAIANNFGKKKMEYAKMPYSMKKSEESEDRFENLTEAEKIIEVKNIFAKLTSVESKFQMGGE